MTRRVSDHDIFRSANSWLRIHGKSAVGKAREMQAHFREKGDHEAADTWLRIIAALERPRRGPLGVVS